MPVRSIFYGAAAIALFTQGIPAIIHLIIMSQMSSGDRALEWYGFVYYQAICAAVTIVALLVMLPAWYVFGKFDLRQWYCYSLYAAALGCAPFILLHGRLQAYQPKPQSERVTEIAIMAIIAGTLGFAFWLGGVWYAARSQRYQ